MRQPARMLVVGFALMVAIVASAQTPRPSLTNEVPTVRYENIGDGDVREIQQVLAKLLYGSTPVRLTSIGTVVQGCYCDEDGPCTDEVGVSIEATSAQPRPRRLQFVKVDKAWRLSRLTAWQIELDRIDDGYRQALLTADRTDRAALLRDYTEKRTAHFVERPKCHTSDPDLRVPPTFRKPPSAASRPADSSR